MPITRPQFREWMNGNETFFRELMKEVRQGSRTLRSVRKGARSDLPKPVNRWRPSCDAPRVVDAFGMVTTLSNRDGWVGLVALGVAQTHKALVLLYTHRWRTGS